MNKEEAATSTDVNQMVWQLFCCQTYEKMLRWTIFECGFNGLLMVLCHEIAQVQFHGMAGTR